MSPAFTWTRRIVQLLVGLFAYGIAISLMVQAGIGVAPWDVLTQGISHQTGWDFGLLTNIIGVGVLVCWIPIRQRPGIGTLSDAILVGFVIDAALPLLPRPGVITARVAFLLAAIVLNAVATALYVGAGLGPGPWPSALNTFHQT